MITNLRDQLIRDEGCVLHVYLDQLGIRTAGVGHNLESHGIDLPVGTPITQDQADEWLDADIQVARNQLITALPWTANLDDVRQSVLVAMCFNMGIGVPGGPHGLLSFRHTLAFIEQGDYQSAADNMVSSGWARQVGARATRLATQLTSSEWQ